MNSLPFEYQGKGTIIMTNTSAMGYMIRAAKQAGLDQGDIKLLVVL